MARSGRPVGALRAEFPWGILVISDRQSDPQVPDPTSPLDRVTASHDAATIIVMHGQFGEVDVRVWAADLAEPAIQPTALGTCQLTTATGQLVIGEVQRTSTRVIAVAPGTYELRVFGDDFEEPEVVDILLSKVPG